MSNCKKFPNKFKDYALYWDDEFIAIGSLEFLSKFINVPYNSFRRFSSSSYLRKTNYHNWVLFKIKDDDAYIYFEGK